MSKNAAYKTPWVTAAKVLHDWTLLSDLADSLAGGCLVASWNRHDSRVLYGTQDGSPAVVPMSVIGQFRLVVSTVIEKTKIRLYRRHRRICRRAPNEIDISKRNALQERPPALLEHPPASLGVLSVTGHAGKSSGTCCFSRRLLQAWKTT